jgi:uracil-DNA glycosylase family protein
MAASRKSTATSARDYLPDTRSYRALAAAAAHCRGCDLYKHATQTVFGEGRRTARMLLVGEQPGDMEDREGRPFVGPAGRVLDEALEEAGIHREHVYLTNAVKHFKFESRGKRRLHKKPGAREMAACHPWLEAEIQWVRPEILVCLGATAAQALFGRDFRITQQRGEVFETEWCDITLATYHPSAILRGPDSEARDKTRRLLIEDLKLAASLLSD